MQYLPGYLIILLTMFSVACASADTANGQNSEERSRLTGTLITDEYRVAIYTGCAEGEVSCDRIEAQLQALDGTQTTELHGSTMHSLCADGQTPCRFLGYHLSHGDREYRILENGQLSIKRCDQLGCESLYNERGTWQY